MDMTEKNGQPSMEEILASIRRIIAEEPADAISIDLNAKGGAAASDVGADEPSEFELPSMFRPTSSTAAEKPTPLFGRLTDAIRGAAQGATGDKAAHATEMSASSEQDHANARGEPTNLTYPALSALKSVRPEPEKRFEPSQPARMSGAPVNPLNDPALYFATAANADVKREMASFMDTRFSGMAPPAGAPAPVVVTQPVQPPPPAEPPSPVDFSSIVPARMERPVDYSAAPPPLTNTNQHYGGYSPAETGYRAGPAEAQPSGGGLEDSTAELLRPMLRQWLAENMPRMVEKALHIEVAESVKPGKKPGMP